MKAIEYRQQKGGGFAAAGGCRGDQITPGQDDRDCGGLNRGGTKMALRRSDSRMAGERDRSEKDKRTPCFRASGFRLGEEPNKRF